MYPRHIEDLNKDGKGDIIGFGNSAIYAAYSTGSKFGNYFTINSATWCRSKGGWTTFNSYPRWVKDVNGDGYPDVVGYASSGVYIALGNGKKFGSQKKWHGYYSTGSTWSNFDLYPRHVADVNGDGKADVVGFSCCSVQVSLSNGSKFDNSMVIWSSQLNVKTGWSKF